MEFNREFNATFNELVENEIVGLGKSLDEKKLKNLLTDIGFENFIIGQAICGETTLVTYVCETLDREREDSALLIDDGDKTFFKVSVKLTFMLT